MARQLTIFDDTILEPPRSNGIKETENGFVLSRRDRNTVTVELTDTCIEVRYTVLLPVRDMPPDDLPPYKLIGAKLCPKDYYHSKHETIVSQTNLFDYYALSKKIALGLIQGWQTDKPDNKWIVDWLIKKTAKIWGKDIHAAWRKLIEKAPEKMVAVHKATFSANFNNFERKAGEFYPWVYENPYIVKDVVQFRAAAMVLHNIRDLAVRYIQKKYDLPLGLMMDFEIANNPVDWDLWPILLTHSQPTRTVMRTLANLPGNIPMSVLENLAYVDLERPLTNRLELLVTLLTWSYPNKDVFRHATNDKIKSAMARVGKHLHRDLSPQRISDVKMFVNFLGDYPEKHGGGIVGLTKKTIDWHIQDLEKERKKILERYPTQTKLATPPIPVPDNPKIRLMKTVGDLADEADFMKHCVLTYTPQVVDGKSYIFHVEHNKEHATVEVTHADCKVVQAHGPRNKPSKAAAYGARILAQWAKNLADTNPIVHDDHREQVTRKNIKNINDPFLGTVTIENTPHYLC